MVKKNNAAPGNVNAKKWAIGNVILARQEKIASGDFVKVRFVKVVLADFRLLCRLASVKDHRIVFDIDSRSKRITEKVLLV